MTTLVSRLIFTLADAAIKATVLLALAAAIVLLSRRASASCRHLVWALGLGCVLGLPLLSWNLPHWRVPVTTPPTHSPAAPSQPPAEAPSPASSAAPTSTRAESPALPTARPASPAVLRPAAEAPVEVAGPATPLPAAPGVPIPWPVWALLVWAGGAAFVLAQLARGLRTVRRITRSSLPVTVGPAADAAAMAAQALGVGRPVALRQASSSGPVTVPLTYGARRPVLVLPANAQAWPEARLRAVLLHEMAHVRRHDWPLQVMALGVRALFWFHPLVWIAAKRMHAEAEAACDDLVLGAGVLAKDYARHLLDVALSARQSRRVGWGAVAMVQTPRVEGRLRAVLAPGLSRRPVTGKTAAGLVAAALLLALPLAALRLVAQGEAVPAADRLQLQGDFTLRYAVTITDRESPQAQFREYQQLRSDYSALLKKDPYYQPVPADFYGPFSYFQERLPRTRHEFITVSAHGGQLLWRSQEGGHTFASVYNGRNGTQPFSDGHAGGIEPGLKFDEMTDCPLPAVGLPHVPLIKGATLVNASGAEQTWQGMCPIEGVEAEAGQAFYTLGLAHATLDGGQWKVLDLDSLEQRFLFLQHRRFQGLWVASHILLTKYTDDDTSAPSPIFRSLKEFMDYADAHRTPTRVCEYRLLSASNTPLDMSTAGMRSVSAAAPPAAQTPPLDDLDVQEALHLRYHLQGWAEDHKGLLQQMAQAQPNARAAVARVDASLSGLPFPLWPGDPRPNHVWDGDPRTGHDGKKPLFTTEHPSPLDGGASRDFALARSRGPGASHVILWASGRITRATRQGKAKMEKQQEIVPTFVGDDGTSNLAGNVPQTASGRSPVAPLAPQPKGEAQPATARWQQVAQTAHQTAHPQDGLMVVGPLKPSAVRDAAILTQARSEMMKNNPHGLGKALTTALVSTLTFPLFGSSPPPSAAQTAKETPGQRTSLRDVGGANIAGRASAQSASGQATPASQGGAAPHRVAVAAVIADPNVTEAQEQLRRVTVGYQAGVNSRSDVGEATIALAEARVHSTAARDEFTGIGPDLETVVTQRQQLLGEAQTLFRVGAISTSDVNKAEEALAEARVRADLYAVLTARQSAFAEISVRYKSNAASAQEMDKATAALQKAEHTFIATLIESGGD